MRLPRALTLAAAVLCMAAAFAIRAGAQQVDSTLYIRESVVKATNPSVPYSGRLGRWAISLEDKGALPQVIDNGDLINLFRYLPGVQTSSPVCGGIYVEGCESSQTLLTIDGMPIYNSSHLMGFLSTFSSTHFSSAELDCQGRTEDQPHIGGTVTVSSGHRRPDSLHLNANLGLLYSFITLKAPVGRRCWFNVSARASYLNFLYDGLLRRNDLDGLRYSFYDVNADFNSLLTSRDELKLAIFHGRDFTALGYGASDLNADMNWGNSAGSLTWKHRFANGNLENTLYLTNFSNSVALSYQPSRINLDAFVFDVGYKVVRDIHFNKCFIKAGFSHIVHSSTPLCTSADLWSSTQFSSSYQKAKSSETGIFGSLNYLINNELQADFGLKATLFHYDAIYPGLDPSASLTWTTKRHSDLKLQISYNHQFLHKLSLTEATLPLDSWIPASSLAGPQRSYDASLSYFHHFSTKDWTLASRVYARRLFEQVENGEYIWTIIAQGSHQLDNLLVGDGYAYGIGLTVQRNSGKLTGLFNCNLGRSLRRYSEFGDRFFPASHERILDLKMVLDYRFGKALSASASFVHSSGLPYTSPDCFYIISGSVICEFTQHNNDRMPDFQRLDLSLNYRLPITRVDSGLSLTLNNALFHSNVFMYRLKVKEDSLSYTPIAFSFCMPILNYYVRF